MARFAVGGRTRFVRCPIFVRVTGQIDVFGSAGGAITSSSKSPVPRPCRALTM